MPALGHTSPDVSATDSNPVNSMIVTLKRTANPQGGVCGSMWQYFQGYGGGTGTNQKFRAVIYQANGASAAPGTLIGVTDEVAFGNGIMWQRFSGWTSFGGPPSLAPSTDYWLGLWFGPSDGSASAFIYAATGGLGMYYSSAVPYNATANPPAVSWTNLGAGNQEYDTWLDYVSPVVAGIAYGGLLRRRGAPRPRPFRPGVRRFSVLPIAA